MNCISIWQRAKKYWNRFRHRLILKLSFRINGALLCRHLKRAGVRTDHRRVIVISQVEHLGDIVACEPVVREMRRQWPGAFIVFALRPEYRELMDVHPDVDYVLPVTCVSEWARYTVSDIFNQVIDLNIEDRKCRICCESWYKRIGNHGVTFSNYLNLGSLMESFCRSAGITPPNGGPKIYQDKNNVTIINNFRLPNSFVVIHTNSNMPNKSLPSNMWQQIFSYITRRWDLPIVEIGLETGILMSNETRNRCLCGQLSILQSAEVIRRSVLFLGVDSGPAHLANAVGAYGIIILGHYQHFRRYIPYSGDYAHGIRSELLHHDGPIAEIPITRIFEAIDRRLSAVMIPGLKLS